jgi:hypothetical protein
MTARLSIMPWSVEGPTSLFSLSRIRRLPAGPWIGRSYRDAGLV